MYKFKNILWVLGFVVWIINVFSGIFLILIQVYCPPQTQNILHFCGPKTQYNVEGFFIHFLRFYSQFSGIFFRSVYLSSLFRLRVTRFGKLVFREHFLILVNAVANIFSFDFALSSCFCLLILVLNRIRSIKFLISELQRISKLQK